MDPLSDRTIGIPLTGSAYLFWTGENCTGTAWLQAPAATGGTYSPYATQTPDHTWVAADLNATPATLNYQSISLSGSCGRTGSQTLAVPARVLPLLIWPDSATGPITVATGVIGDTFVRIS